MRYALAEYGERDLGFSKSEAKLFLDHLEGTESDDVTGQFYSTNPAIARKEATDDVGLVRVAGYVG